MNYIDLFCGIGGFHQGIENVMNRRYADESVKCIFAADNNKKVAELYKKTYGINAYYDLSKDSTHNLISEKVKEFGDIDVVCAGFPCQAFSKAGNQEGFLNETKGTLFFQVAKIIKNNNPKLVLLENVRNLKNHDKKKTWKVIKKTLERLGYIVDHVIISPNCFGVPALRERIFIMCYRKDLKVNTDLFYNGEKIEQIPTTIYNNRGNLNRLYFSKNQIQNISEEKIKILEMYEDLNIRLQNAGKRMYSPMWTKYYFDFKGSIDNEPDWKQILIKKNIKFYNENRIIIDQWKYDYINLWDSINDTCKKFEWNAGNDINSIWEGIIQFRPSGIRLKKPDFLPTFVAINQVPILACEKRYITPKEMAKLYGFKKIRFINDINESYKQIGNTVSVDVVEHVFEHMLDNVNIGG